MPDVGNSGFASEADKLETAYQLYNKLTGTVNRMAVVRGFNQMLRMNGVDVEVVMKPLVFNDFGGDNDTAQKTDSADVNKEDVADNNIEEKVEEK